MLDLKFANKAERMKHPQASLISDRQWKYIFEESLTEDVLALMKCPEQELTIKLKESRSLTLVDKKKAWLAIALSHPDTNHELLLKTAELLSLPQKEIFEMTGAWGDEKFLRFLELKIPNRLPDIIRDTFIEAGYNGHAHLLEYLGSKLSENMKYSTWGILFDSGVGQACCSIRG